MKWDSRNPCVQQIQEFHGSNIQQYFCSPKNLSLFFSGKIKIFCLCKYKAFYNPAYRLFNYRKARVHIHSSIYVYEPLQSKFIYTPYHHKDLNILLPPPPLSKESSCYIALASFELAMCPRLV